MMSMAPLLIHSDSVPPSAKAALREATTSTEPKALLVEAAKALYAETGLPCEDVLELVGLTKEDCGCSED
jgi:hypothetical protein